MRGEAAVAQDGDGEDECALCVAQLHAVARVAVQPGTAQREREHKEEIHDGVQRAVERKKGRRGKGGGTDTNCERWCCDDETKRNEIK